eukprot:NODE_2628_length_902_cov_303.714286.p4 GENE.NODE_2628_length_902_cov_303.714286~~NODE_2628_length_902_cov_303.714286.p4  ORF type:complete len:90 (-),score=28.00 NODE_2628_length_902_cov_303.714286:235-504(-)
MSNDTLEILRLGGNKIGNAGAKALAEALTTNNTLKSLYLYKNKIGDDGAKALHAVCDHKSYFDLDLRYQKAESSEDEEERSEDEGSNWL